MWYILGHVPLNTTCPCPSIIPCDLYLQIVSDFFYCCIFFHNMACCFVFVCYLTHIISANHYKINHKKLLPKYFLGGIAKTFKSIFSKTKIATCQNDRTVMCAIEQTILGGFIRFYKES